MSKMSEFRALATDRFMEAIMEYLEDWNADDTIADLMVEVGIDEPTDKQTDDADDYMSIILKQFIDRVRKAEGMDGPSTGQGE